MEHRINLSAPKKDKNHRMNSKVNDHMKVNHLKKIMKPNRIKLKIYNHKVKILILHNLFSEP